jgi:hypothetical protein
MTYTVARICLDGHLIGFDRGVEVTGRSGLSHYREGDRFCVRCGNKAITNCLNCNRAIRGEPDVTWMAVDALPPYSIPAFCYGCGRPYPWTERRLPEEEIKGMYESGEQYAFYRDLSSLIATAIREIFIIDAYLDEQVFNLYVDKVPTSATVRVLSNKIGINVKTVAKMYADGRSLEPRSSADIHDRAIFLDQRGWVMWFVAWVGAFFLKRRAALDDEERQDLETLRAATLTLNRAQRERQLKPEHSHISRPPEE